MSEEIKEKMPDLPQVPENEKKEKEGSAGSTGVLSKIGKAGKILRKVIKGIIWTISSLLALLLILLVCVVIFIDPIVKGVVENFGPEIAGVRFEVEKVDVQIFKGRVEIKNLFMYNPEGYSTDFAVKLGDIALETDIMSWINSKKAIIREVRIKDVIVNYETVVTLDNSNIKDILDHVQKVTSGAPAPAAEQPAAEPAPEQPAAPAPEQPAEPAPEQPSAPAAEPAPEQPVEDNERRFQLDKLIFENVQLIVTLKEKPEVKVPITITLPQMGPVGTDEKGVTADELVSALTMDIFNGIYTSVIKSSKEIYAVATEMGMQIADEVKQKVKEYEDDIRDLVDAFKDGRGEEAVEKGKKIVDDLLKDEGVRKIGDGVKGLFKRDK